MEQATIICGERTSLPRALLVFDEGQQLLGIVRRRDILRGLEPKFLRTMPITHRKQLFEVEVDPNLVILSTGKIAKAVQEQAEQKVSEVMQPIVATVKHSDHLTKVIYKMIHWNLALLPVLEEGNVIGVVRSVDAFHEIAKLVL
jgi:predicted transcriptional regulator